MQLGQETNRPRTKLSTEQDNLAMRTEKLYCRVHTNLYITHN